MARGKRSSRKSRKSNQSKVFQGMGAAWENETKNGDALISLKVDIEDFLDWIDAIKLDDLPDEETKLSIILLEQTKSSKRGAPDFVVYGLDPVLAEEDEKPKRRKRKSRDEEPEEEEEEKPRRRKKPKPEPEEEYEEEEEKPKKRKKRAKKSEEDEKELDLDFEEE